MAEQADVAKQKEKAERKKYRSKIDDEINKVVTVLQAGEAFGAIDTKEKFLAEVEKMYKAYGLVFDKNKFKFIVDNRDGNNKKTK